MNIHPAQAGRYYYALRQLRRGQFVIWERLDNPGNGIARATVLALTYHGIAKKIWITLAQDDEGAVFIVIDPNGLIEHGAIHRAFKGTAPRWLEITCKKKGTIKDESFNEETFARELSTAA